MQIETTKSTWRLLEHDWSNKKIGELVLRVKEATNVTSNERVWLPKIKSADLKNSCKLPEIHGIRSWTNNVKKAMAWIIIARKHIFQVFTMLSLEINYHFLTRVLTMLKEIMTAQLNLSMNPTWYNLLQWEIRCWE